MSLQETAVEESIPIVSEIIVKIIAEATTIIGEKLLTERLPIFTAQFFTSIFKEELRTPMLRYDMGERPEDLKQFWSPDEEPSAHDVDSLAKHFVMVNRLEIQNKSLKPEISLQNLDNGSSLKESMTGNRINRLKSVFDGSPHASQGVMSRQSFFISSNVGLENARANISPAAMIKYVNNFKINPQKTLKHSKSQTLKNFLSKPPITPQAFNKNIALVKIKETNEVEEKEQAIALLTSGKLIGNTKMMLDNVFINKKEEEFRAMKNTVPKPAPVALPPRPVTAFSPKKGKRGKNSFDKSGFDIHGEKIMYKEVKEEDLNQNNFAHTNYAEKRGRSALPVYANGPLTRRESEG